MRSRRCPRYEKEYNRLQKQLQKKADTAMERFAINPRRRSLHFKQVAPGHYSIRINLQYRILGFLEGSIEDGEIVWYWVGPHAKCDQQILRWRRSI